jgi:hypothetical protein
LNEERLKTEVENFKEFAESRRATSGMCHEIITDLVVLGTPREDQLSVAAPLKEMDANVNVDEVDTSKEGTDQDDDCEAPYKRNRSDLKPEMRQCQDAGKVDDNLHGLTQTDCKPSLKAGKGNTASKLKATAKRRKR